jgi:hypothetical protein
MRYGKLPRSWRSKEVIEFVGQFFGGIINPETIRFLSSSPYDAFSMHIGENVIEQVKKDYQYYANPMVERDHYMTFDQYLKNHFQSDPVYQLFIEKMQQQVKTLLNDSPISIIISKLFEDYPLEKYRYKLIDHLKIISQTKFKMTHKVKYIAQAPKFSDKGKRTDKGRLIDLNYEMHDFQNIFEVRVEKDDLVLNFNTPLGKMILHNMFILDTDYCPFEVMNLSKNAYFIYKRFILNRVAGANKATSIELNFNELKKFLNVRWGNDSGVYRIIQTALRDLEKNDLIGGFTFEKHHIDRRRYKVHFRKALEKHEESDDKDAGILKL